MNVFMVVPKHTSSWWSLSTQHKTFTLPLTFMNMLATVNKGLSPLTVMQVLKCIPDQVLRVVHFHSVKCLFLWLMLLFVLLFLKDFSIMHELC